MSLFIEKLDALIGGNEFYTVFGSNIVKAKLIAYADDMATLKIIEDDRNLKLTMHYTNIVFVTN